MFRKSLLVVLVGAWIAAIATSHTFGGWLHMLPAIVLAAILLRAAYELLTLD
jgi:hypothetical protein